jgi:3-methylcrotonyl-CoA carboxylase alpha subunit
MNTRLQVEHPVTEMVTGLDLVELQIRIAAGEALPFSQKELKLEGHAIEARIYAEDPERDFLPATGKLVHVALPQESAEVRVDAGVAAGDEITPWYDPMIAKLIVRGADRDRALARLRQALGEVEIAGVKTNVAFLRRIALSAAFSRAELDTGLIERNREELLPQPLPAGTDLLAAAAFAELAEEERSARERAARSGDPYSPWHKVDGWRLNADSHHDFVFLDGATEHPVRVHFAESGLRLAVDGTEHAFAGAPLEDGSLSVRLDERVFKARAVRDGENWHVFSAGDYRRLTLRQALPNQDEEVRIGSLAAPMPGRIIQVMSRPGDAVKKGQALLILEAMKMEHTITAPVDGVVKEIHFAAGEQVLEGAELVRLE